MEVWLWLCVWVGGWWCVCVGGRGRIRWVGGVSVCGCGWVGWLVSWTPAFGAALWRPGMLTVLAATPPPPLSSPPHHHPPPPTTTHHPHITSLRALPEPLVCVSVSVSVSVCVCVYTHAFCVSLTRVGVCLCVHDNRSHACLSPKLFLHPSAQSCIQAQQISRDG